eukprot:6438_1
MSTEEYSTLVSIIYFVLNIVCMLALAYYVYVSVNEHKVKSKSYLKDVWSQRKIVMPLVIHFYDTATDIGVIYNWAELMEKEQKPGKDYRSVDMKSFFWCGVAFLIIFRVGMLLWSIYQWYSGDGEWYYVLLVLLDLFIFVIVYESFSDAQGVMTKNAQRRKENAERKKKKRDEKIDKELEQAVDEGQISGDKAAQIKAALDEAEVEPSDAQMALQLCESVTESMPQIVLQSVFIIRSANDKDLTADGSNIGLLLFSVLASLFSISNKFVWMDKDNVFECARTMKLRRRCPGCIQWWYVARVLWRLVHVFAKFAVFTLIWTVLGGMWLPIWTATWYIIWAVVLIVFILSEEEKSLNCKRWCQMICSAFAVAIGFLVAIVIVQRDTVSHFILKWTETSAAFIIITIFATMKFECKGCASSGMRTLFNNETNNTRILIYWLLGMVAHVMDVILYLVLYFGNIFKDDDASVIRHNRWGYKFSYEHTSSGVPFKNVAGDHQKDRITGIRIAGKNKVKSIEFQVNGIWTGRMGAKAGAFREDSLSDSRGEDLVDNELILDENEYVSEVMITKDWSSSITAVKFTTNKGNTIMAGKWPGDGKKIKTLRGDFKLVDCKGSFKSDEVSGLQFLWHRTT